MKSRTPTAPFHYLLLSLIFLVLVGCESTSSSGHSSHHRFRFSLFSYNVRSDGQQCLAEWGRAPALAPSLWQRVESRYQLPNSRTNPRVVKERQWYASHQAYLDRMSARSARYLYYVTAQLEARNLPGELALLPIVESAYNPFAISTSQASGLWQFIPSTAKHLKMEMNWWYDARRDIPAATNTALDYLVFLRDHYNGDWLKALAAYNAGWGTIDKAVAKNAARGLPTDYWSLDVPTETMAYVPKLLALAQISQDPAAYGVDWAYIPDLPYFAEVHFSGQIDVAFAADLAKVDSDELHLLNPGITRWATPPGGPYRLLVPIDQANDLQERIANMSSSDLMPNPSSAYANTANTYVQEMEEKAARNSRTKAAQSTSRTSSRSYTVKSGDTLWSIAKKAGMTPDALQKLNHFNSKTALRPGQKITLQNSGSSSSSSAYASSKSKATYSSAHSGRVNQTYSPANDTNVAASTPKSNKSKTHSTKTATTKTTTHTVKSGDTLMAISRKYNVKVEDIMRWNSLSKNNTAIKPGQRITLQLSK